MKKLLLKSMAGVAAGALMVAGFSALTIGCGSGCMTVTTPASGTNPPVSFQMLDTNAVISGIGLVVPPLVSLACSKDTNAAPYFTQASILIKTLAQTGVVDPAQVQSSLSTISIRELRSPTAVAAENAAISLYNSFAAQVVLQQTDKVAWLRPVLGAVGNAIAAGIPARP